MPDCEAFNVILLFWLSVLILTFLKIAIDFETGVKGAIAARNAERSMWASPFIFPFYLTIWQSVILDWHYPHLGGEINTFLLELNSNNSLTVT